MADGIVNEREADFLITWLQENHHLTCWPFDVLNTRVAQMLEDGVIDAEERAELLSILQSLVGEKPVAEHISSFTTITTSLDYLVLDHMGTTRMGG